MKVVADTMLWVSYCSRKDGYWQELLERACRQRVRIFTSEYILSELYDTLVEDLEQSHRYASRARSKVQRLTKLVILPSFIPPFIPGDPNDNPVVQTALSAKADYLVTADSEILRLAKFHDLQILHPTQFEERLDPEE